jgi:hypothetical protein
MSRGSWLVGGALAALILILTVGVALVIQAYPGLGDQIWPERAMGPRVVM